MPTTFSQRIDWPDPADDPFSLGLLQLRSEFCRDWAKLELKAISSCNEERRRALHSKPVPTGSLEGTLPYHAKFRVILPPKLRRTYWLPRDYLNLLTQLDRTLLQSAFKGWLSAVRDLVQEYFQDAFEIAAANPHRTRQDDPQEFSRQFLQALIDGVVEDRIDGLVWDDFLWNFFKNQNARSKKAKDMLVLFRGLLGSALFRQLLELSSHAQIELAKRGRTKATNPSSPPAQESEVAPTPDNAGAASRLRLRHLEAPPEHMSVSDVVMKIFPELKKALLDARYYLVEEQKNNNHPSARDLSEKFPLLADAAESEIEKYVIRRESTAHEATLQMIQKIRPLPVGTINRYRHRMRNKPSGDCKVTEAAKDNEKNRNPKMT